MKIRVHPSVCPINQNSQANKKFHKMRHRDNTQVPRVTHNLNYLIDMTLRGIPLKYQKIHGESKQERVSRRIII